MTRPTVAVVGSGVAGITAAYVLQRTHEVTLIEADDRLGGHAHTHDLVDPDGHAIAVDTGFIVHNDRTYPTLLRLFSELGVTTQPTEMSLSVRCDGCGLEYCGGRGASGIVPGLDALRPSYPRMLGEIVRFHRMARRVSAATDPDDDGPTLGEFVRQGRFSRYFVAHFMTPVVASVWSCGPATAGQYPAHYLFTFLEHHGMLTVGGSPAWRTVVGGSRTYVELAVKDLRAVRTGVPVRSISRKFGTVLVHDEEDSVSEFDQVVVATHPDQALRLLADPTDEEQATLGSFRYSTNPTLLHRDTSILPKKDRARASWNYRMTGCDDRADRVQITYDMVRLQRLDTDWPHLVSLNAAAAVDPGCVIAEMVYHHPQYTPTSVAAQRHLPSLNDGVTAFAGAYHGWGFHEDGARAGLAAAESLGGRW